MDEVNKRELVQRFQIEQSLKQQFEGTLPHRVNRYLQVKPYPIIANTHFAAVSAQCFQLFHDGYFYGCIALTQAVAEALVKFLCQRKRFKPEKKFEANVGKLAERKFISQQTKGSFLKIWEHRDDYHHLNPDIENDHRLYNLEELAKEKLLLLSEIESDVFQSKIVNGELLVKNPEYWDITEKGANVFLRFEP